MSTISRTAARCPGCSQSFAVDTIDSANVQRMPSFREELLAGRFGVARCPGCEVPSVVQMDKLLYTDLPRRQFVAVFAPHRRHQVARLEREVANAFTRAFVEQAPAPVRRSAHLVGQRVVFGYGELREKVVCWDAGLDDRVLEALKLQVLQANTGLSALQLDLVQGADLVFHARYRGAPGALTLQRRQYDGLAAMRSTLLELLPHLFGGAYVNVDSVLESAA